MLHGRIEGKAMDVLLACKARINKMMTFYNANGSNYKCFFVMCFTFP